MGRVLGQQQCGFGGAFLNGVSFLNGVRPERPDQQIVKFCAKDLTPRQSGEILAGPYGIGVSLKA
jgi:hypothetical protein